MNQILTKHISCECKCKFDGKKCNSNQKWNNDKCWCECKKHHICEKDYIGNRAACSCESGKYSVSIDDSVIACDKIIEETKLVPASFNEKKATHKTQFFCILLTFLLITIELLIVVRICCYLIKYKSKQEVLY